MFFMIFHRNLEVMMFSRNMKNDMVFILILGGLNIAISLVLDVFSEFHVFTGAFSIDFFEHFNGKHMCIGGAQELTTMEILM